MKKPNLVHRNGTWPRWLAIVVMVIASAIATGAQARPGAPSYDAPIAIEFPKDDGSHDSAIEWWYLTGHLFAETGERFGFEFVIFRARSGELEGYVSHFALTDVQRTTFAYDQKVVGAGRVAGTSAPLDLEIDGWSIVGGDGVFSLAAQMHDFAIDLEVASTKPAALHDGDGHIDYGNGTSSYYYSWTRMLATGELRVGERLLEVSGEAWMDHQWGDFETYQDGGWDWFALQLDDGTDVMLYLIRDVDGDALRVDGTVVPRDGSREFLREGDFQVVRTGSWTSPRTGTEYPSGWDINVPSLGLQLTVRPTLLDQELDTRRTTGVIYWEGEVVVTGMREERPVFGLGYVELTGYAPYEPLDLSNVVATPSRAEATPGN